MLDGMPYCLDDFHNDTLSLGEFCSCRHLSMDRGISRGMPRDQDLASYAQAMKIILIDGSIDLRNQRIPQTIHEIVAEAYRRGFVNLNMAGLYTLPSPLHQQLWSWRLGLQANYQLPPSPAPSPAPSPPPALAATPATPATSPSPRRNRRLPPPPRTPSPKLPPAHLGSFVYPSLPFPITPRTLPPNRCTTLIMEGVSKFTINLQSTFERFLKENVQLPLWQPPSHLADDTRRHLTGLKIPIISPSSPIPLLLLHNLGQPSHDAHLAKRVEGLFGQESK